MDQISIQDLKARLSAALAEAEAGGRIVITRHNKPVAQLSAALPEYVHRGGNAGGGGIKPVLRRGTRGRYLAILLEDRGEP